MKIIAVCFFIHILLFAWQGHVFLCKVTTSNCKIYVMYIYGYVYIEREENIRYKLI